MTEPTLDSILDEACSVLRDYGADDDTRISRMAKFIVARLGGQPYAIQVEGTVGRAILQGEKFAIWRTGDQFGIGTTEKVMFGLPSAHSAEEIAVAVLRLLEMAPRGN